jgi:hypothetical protein
MLMKKGRNAWIVAAVLCVAVVAVLIIGKGMKPDKKEASVENAGPPREKEVDAVEVMLPTELMTEDGLFLLEVPEGAIFELAADEDDVVWVYGPSGTRYKIRHEDVSAILKHRVSMDGYDDAELKQFGFQVAAARVAAVMQSAYPEEGTQLTVGMRTEWQDKVEIEMATKSGISIPQYSLMVEWAVYKGWLD